jgi:hypothetical protein
LARARIQQLEHIMSSENLLGGCNQEQYDTVFSIFNSSVLATAVCNSISQQETVNGLRRQLSELRIGVNSAWLLICGALVFIMHGGFAMVRKALFRVKG